MERVLAVSWLEMQALIPAVQGRPPRVEEDYKVLRIFAYLTLGNSMSSTPMFFSEKTHCIVSILCEHGKERGKMVKV